MNLDIIMVSQSGMGDNRLHEGPQADFMDAPFPVEHEQPIGLAVLLPDGQPLRESADTLLADIDCSALLALALPDMDAPFPDVNVLDLQIAGFRSTQTAIDEHGEDGAGEGYLALRALPLAGREKRGNLLIRDRLALRSIKMRRCHLLGGIGLYDAVGDQERAEASQRMEDPPNGAGPITAPGKIVQEAPERRKVEGV